MSNINASYEKYHKMIYRICFSYLKNPQDTEDMVQETFLKLMSSGKEFDNAEHEKAWLIVTSSNLCKNYVKHWSRKNEDLNDHSYLSDDKPLELDIALEAVLALPEKYKTVLYLHYYEDLTCADIASTLLMNESTVRGILREGREKLKVTLAADIDKLPEVEVTLYGDVILDGRVTKKDVEVLFQYLHGIRNLTAQQLKNADVNNDGIVNKIDLCLINGAVNGENLLPKYTEGD